MRESAVRLPICDASGDCAAQDGADARAGEDDAGAGALVVDLEDVGSRWEDFAQLAHDAIRGDDGHVGLEAVVRALVDGEHARQVAAAGADDLRRDGRADVVLAEGEQGLQAPTLERVLGDGGLLDAHARELLLQVLDSAGGRGGGRCSPTSRGAAPADAVGGTLERRHGGGSPHADEAHAAAVGSSGSDRSAHLHRQRDGLRPAGPR